MQELSHKVQEMRHKLLLAEKERDTLLRAYNAVRKHRDRAVRTLRMIRKDVTDWAEGVL